MLKPQPPRHPTGVHSLHNPRRPSFFTSIPHAVQFRMGFCGGTYILKSFTRGFTMSARHASKSLSFTAPQLAPRVRYSSPTTKLDSEMACFGFGSQDGEIGVGFQMRLIVDSLIDLLLQGYLFYFLSNLFQFLIKIGFPRFLFF